MQLSGGSLIVIAWAFVWADSGHDRGIRDTRQHSMGICGRSVSSGVGDNFGAAP